MKMRFNAKQTHNQFDCEIQEKDANGRIRIVRRVDKRIGYILTAFGRSPKGFPTVNAIVDSLNRLHKNASYSYNDIYPTLKRMEVVGMIEENNGWKLSPRGKAAWEKCKKDIRGLK